MPHDSFRVATFNIHHAEGRDGITDIERIADVIRSAGADLIALQELDVGAPRSGGVDQPAELARLLGVKVHFGPAMDLDEGRYGIGLASRDDFQATTVRLPRLASEEPRAAIVGNWNGLGVVTTHLSRNPRARALQTEELARIGSAMDGPVIVVGDLNQAESDLGPLRVAGMTVARPRRSLRDRFRRGWQIDHIAVSKGLKITRSWTIATTASDHAVLVADIRRGK